MTPSTGPGIFLAVISASILALATFANLYPCAAAMSTTQTDRVVVNSKAKRKTTPKRKTNVPKPTAEAALWNSIKDSKAKEDFAKYLKRYPHGKHVTAAKEKLHAMEAAAVAIKRTVQPESKIAPMVPAASIARNKMGMELVLVTPIPFIMGSTTGAHDEKPEHKVTIKESFYISRYEVTQADWYQVMGTNPSHFRGDHLPVETVSWDDVQSFLKILNHRDKEFEYRLPTEAEWEFAARAESNGDEAGHELHKVAWFSANSDGHTHEVGGKQPNAYGLYDMRGNVWEYCADDYHRSYDGAPEDGSAWLSDGKERQRVLRGGSWGALATLTQRLAFTPDKGDVSVGFRVVAGSDHSRHPGQEL